MTALGRLISDRRGVALVETAFAMILFMTMILGVVEVGRFVLLNQKLDRAGVTVADLVSQGETISANEVDSLMNAVEFVLQPFAMDANGAVIVSSVAATGTEEPKVMWQRSGAGELSISSHLGPVDADAELPAGVVVRAGESLIIAEVFYEFRPLLFSDLGEISLYHTAFFRPRFGFLTELETE